MKKYFLLVPILVFLISTKLTAQKTKASKQIKPAIQERVINVDFSKSSGILNSFFKECVGAGRLRKSKNKMMVLQF